MVVNLLDRVQDVDLPARERLPHLQVHVEEVAPADRLGSLLDHFDERLIVDADENGRLLAHLHLPPAGGPSQSHPPDKDRKVPARARPTRR